MMASSTAAMRRLALLLLLCWSSTHGDEAALRPSDVNADPARYNERTVEVRGYMTIVPDAHNLYESKELDAEFRRRWDSRDKDFHPMSYDKYCLTIANPYFLNAVRDNVNGKTVTVRGKIMGKYLDDHSIDLGACPLPTAILIDQADFKQRYPSFFTPMR